MNTESVGLCPATLLADPLRCDEADFAGLLEAAASAGFRDLSLWTLHADAVGSTAAVAAIQAKGLRVRAVEAVTQWTRGPGSRLTADAAPVIELAEAAGASIITAYAFDTSMDTARGIEGFGALCEMAGSLKVALEFLPWSGVPDLASAWRLVDRAGQPNGAILLDTWHWSRQRGGCDVKTLGSLPGSRIAYVQLSDATAGASTNLMHEAMAGRLLPGDGTIDFGAVFAALDSIECEPFVAYEVFNRELAAAGPAAMARKLRQSPLPQ